MIINLKIFAARGEEESVKIELQERLPAFISGPAILNCHFNVKMQGNYYLLTLKADSKLKAICQRCLNEFEYHYVNETVLAVCNSDTMAEQLMDQYECVVSDNNQVDLKELLTDELYLYGPEFHPEVTDCDTEVNRYIGE